MTIYDELKARGLIAQVTDEEEIKEVIIKGKTAYGCSNWKAGCQYRQPFSQM